MCYALVKSHLEHCVKFLHDFPIDTQAKVSIWGAEDSKGKLRETTYAYLGNEKTKPYRGRCIMWIRE